MERTTETLVDVFVGNRSDGSPRFETLWVSGLPDGSLRLMRTPKIAFGVARNDNFRVAPDKSIIEVVKSGDYIAVHVVVADPFNATGIEALMALAESLGGTLDVHDDIVAGLAIPADVDPEKLNAAVAKYGADFPIRAWWIASDEAPSVRD